MTALLKKDFYVLKSTLLLYAGIITCLQLAPGNFILFSALYASLLPASAFAYDDRSHWDELAAMLPYSVRDIVLSRYITGWTAILFFNLIELAVRMILQSVLPAYASGWNGFSLFAVQFISLSAVAGSFLAVMLPLYFRFDSEKSRLIRAFLIALVCGAIAVIYMSAGTFAVVNGHTGSLDENITVLLGMSAPGLILVAAILTAISIPLSICAHRARHQ